jgi:chaperonin GroES
MTEFWCCVWKKSKMTAGGIIIPDTAKEKPQEGKVVSTGPGKAGRRRQARSPGGQGRATGSVFQICRHRNQMDGVEHMFMREDDILGILG